MPIKMIATDLDGTLLHTDKTISEYTAAVFRRYREKGTKIVFATARPIRALGILDRLPDKDAAIYHNGAVIEIEHRIHRNIGIDPVTTKRLLLQAVERFGGLQTSVEIDDTLYANFDVSTIWSNTTAVLTDFTDIPGMPSDKIIFCTSDRRIIDEINKMLTDDLYTDIVENLILMVMNKHARKRNAVMEIAEYFGISLSDVVVFGDDYNDIEMLRDCGTGVAVANAVDEAKAVADHICGSNDNDGVAKWLEGLEV